MIQLLTKELGTADFQRGKSYSEDALRMVAHMMMSTPEYQIN